MTQNGGVSGFTTGRRRIHEFINLPLFCLTPSTETAVAVCSVCVRETVDRRSCCTKILPSPLGEQDEDGDDDNDHQDQPCDGDANGEAPL